MRKQKCILTYARSWIALAATRSLGKHGIYVITGDTEQCVAANFSRYSKEKFTYPDPAKDPEGFIDKLVSVAKAHAGSDLVIMPIYTEVYPILCHQERFKGLAKIVLPSKTIYELLRNKALLAVHCEKIGIRVPKTIVLKDKDEFYERARNIEYPAFVKVPTSSGSLGIRKVFSYEKAAEAFEDMVSRYKIESSDHLPILQEAVGGNDYCSTFLFDHGEYKASMTYRNIIDFPKGKGVGALRETVKEHIFEDIGRKLLEEFNWHGICQIDFRWDGESEPWLIEVNPRFWGGLAQSIASGWEFPIWLYNLALDGNLGTIQPEQKDVRTYNPVLMTSRIIQELFSSRSSLNLSGRIKAVSSLVKEGKGAVNEYFLWSDPLPILGLVYPLMIYIKHGKITPELLLGERGIHENKK